MATGLSAATANSFLDALGNATNYTADAEMWIKLHVGDPGASAASNAAVETTRKQASLSAAASGAITTDAALTWTNVAGTEDFTHFSAWSAAAAGTFRLSGTVTANAVVAGDSFSVSTGDLDLSLSTAA